jgi:hypothetical protein
MTIIVRRKLVRALNAKRITMFEYNRVLYTFSDQRIIPVLLNLAQNLDDALGQTRINTKGLIPRTLNQAINLPDTLINKRLFTITFILVLFNRSFSLQLIQAMRSDQRLLTDIFNTNLHGVDLDERVEKRILSSLNTTKKIPPKQKMRAQDIEVIQTSQGNRFIKPNRRILTKLPSIRVPRIKTSALTYVLSSLGDLSSVIP